MMGRKVEYVKVGDVIKDHADEEGNPVNMVVIGVYKHCVVAQKKNGIRRGISFGELVQRGLEPGYGRFNTDSVIQRTDYDLGDE